MINEFLRAKIKEKYAIEKKKDPRFSLRAHAKQLSISAGAYSEFLSGSRRFSDQMAIQIAKKLPLDPQEAAALARLQSPHRQALADEQFAFVKEWHHFAILSLLELDPPPKSSLEISQRLGITLEQAQTSIDGMKNLKLLDESMDGSLILTGLSYTSSDDIPSLVVRASHQDGLGLASRALEEINTSERDFTALTFSGNSRQMAKAKKEIRKCLDKVSQLMAHSEKDQVYRMSIQLFPVLKSGNPE